MQFLTAEILWNNNTPNNSVPAQILKKIITRFVLRWNLKAKTTINCEDHLLTFCWPVTCNIHSDVKIQRLRICKIWGNSKQTDLFQQRVGGGLGGGEGGGGLSQLPGLLLCFPAMLTSFACGMGDEPVTWSLQGQPYQGLFVFWLLA